MCSADACRSARGTPVSPPVTVDPGSIAAPLRSSCAGTTRQVCANTWPSFRTCYLSCTFVRESASQYLQSNNVLPVGVDNGDGNVHGEHFTSVLSLLSNSSTPPQSKQCACLASLLPNSADVMLSRPGTLSSRRYMLDIRSSGSAISSADQIKQSDSASFAAAPCAKAQQTRRLVLQAYMRASP